jgi:TldD protein
MLTRQPVRGFEGSNGHARLPNGQANMAAVSNLFVTSSETTPAADMKKKLIELIQTRNKPYGIIVRKMDFPSTAGIEELTHLIQSQQGSTRPVSMPLLVYKVFPDGREELVRGMRFRGFSARSLKDILATGDNATVFDFIDSAAPFALVGYANFTTESCVVAPSIIIDDLDLHVADEEQPKLPVVTAPEMVK